MAISESAAQMLDGALLCLRFDLRLFSEHLFGLGLAPASIHQLVDGVGVRFSSIGDLSRIAEPESACAALRAISRSLR